MKKEQTGDINSGHQNAFGRGIILENIEISGDFFSFLKNMTLFATWCSTKSFEETWPGKTSFFITDS